MNAKSWWRKAVLLEMGLGVGLAMCMLVTAQAGTIPASQEPQVLVILDTSQGMAGNLQGAIMSGSGTVAANADSASPPCYLLNSYTPRSTLGPSSGGSCPAGEAAYTVSVGGVLTDNSESMINVAEQGILSALNNPTYTNIMQAGLMAYATAGTPAPYDTWVYYMSGDTPTTASPGAECTPGAFGYGSTSGSTCAANDPLSVPNPCYKAPKGGDCAPIANIIGSGLTSAPYLYISQSSDDPQINDVLYWSTSYPSGNFVTYDGPHPSNPYPPNGYSLSRYEDQILSGSYLLETYKATAPNIGAFATSPTDAGYIPYSGEVWYARRGLAFDGNPVTNGTSGGQGDLYIPVAPLNAAQIALFNKTMAPEQFVKGGSEIVAGSEYAPTAGALTAALTDLTTSDKAPQPACAPKYVILITNGQPTMGLHGHVYPPLGSAAGQGYGEVLSSGSADNDNAVTEAITAVKKLANYTNGGLNGIKTYVLGVGAGVNCPPSATNCTTEASDSYTVLKDLAVAGKTNVVYSADTAAAFQQAFNSILNNIAAQIVTASGGSSSAVIGNSSYEYVVTSNPSLGEGNMSAYLIKSSGNLASTASWDINAEMTTSNRSSVLYSEGPPTTTPGPITPLTSMDAAAFAIPSGSTLTPSIIEQYTIDPSYDSGNYLGGRQSGWYVGLMTANKPTYMGPPNDPNLLGSTGYDSYAQSESGRTPLVLVGSNDGFLYAVNAVSGSLVWGWMPRPLVQDLQDYSTFWQGPNMAGMRPRVVDAQAGGSSSAWATYIVGGAQQGAIQYALQLTSTGALNSEAWEQDNANSITPNPVAPVIFRLVPGSGTAYEAAVLNTTTTTTTSALVMTNVATGVADTITLPFVAGSQPYVDDSNDIFIGDNAGNVWMGSLLSSSGQLATKISWTPLNNTAPSPIGTNFGTSASTSGGTSAITYIDGAYYNGVEYLTLQSPGRVTTLQDGANGWAPLWTSYAGGSDTFTSGNYVASTSVASLPSNAIVTNPVQIVNGAIILPVSVPPSAAAGTCAASTASYYFYTLDSGGFPSGVFGATVAGPVDVGTGVAYTPSISIMNGQLRLQGMGSGGPGPSMTTQGPPPAGPASWREIFY